MSSLLPNTPAAPPYFENAEDSPSEETKNAPPRSR